MNGELNQPLSAMSGVAEPKANWTAVPVWLLVLLLLLLYWGMLYFDQHGGWFSQEVYSPYHTIEELTEWQPATEISPLFIGFRVYNKPTCVACHQANGKGTPGQFPS